MLTAALFVLIAQNREEVWIGTVYPETHPPIVRDRVEFTKKFERIAEGMTIRQVRSILGRPDDVLEENEWNWGMYPAATVWKYGSTGKHMLGTYGRVAFEGDVVTSVSERFAENSWENETALVQAMQSMWLYGFYSKLFRVGHAALDRLRAANALISLGLDGARIAIQEFVRTASYRYGVGLPSLIEMLFLPDELSDGIVPLGLRQKWLVAGGVPFLIAGASFPGNGYSAVAQFDELLDVLGFRESPFRPHDDLSEIVQLAGAVLAKDGGGASALFGAQLIDILSTVFDPPEGMDLDDHGKKASARLLELVVDMRAVKVKWNVERQAYTSTNGRMLYRGRPLYKVFRWVPDPLRGSGIEIQVVRESESVFEIRLLRIVPTTLPRPPVPSIVMLIQDPNHNSAVLGFATTFDGADASVSAHLSREEFRRFDPEGRSGTGYPDSLLALTRWGYRADLHPRFTSGSSGSSRLEENPRVFQLSSMSFRPSAQPVRLRVIVDGLTFVSPILRP